MEYPYLKQALTTFIFDRPITLRCLCGGTSILNWEMVIGADYLRCLLYCYIHSKEHES